MTQPLVEGFRLSPAQRHVWLRQGDDVGPYRVRAVVSVRGAIDRGRLEAGISMLVARHEILRTTYRRVSGMKLPMQVVEPEAVESASGAAQRQVHVEIEDLRALDATTQARAVDAAFDALAAVRVDLDRGPVWHARLLLRSATDGTLLLMWPSLVADAASVAIVVRELARLVMAAGGNVANPANAAKIADAAEEDLPLQHVDVAEWQDKLAESDGMAAGREFWRQIDRNALISSRLALRRRQATTTFTPRTLDAPLPADVVPLLQTWADTHDCAPQDVLLAAWQLLMSRLSERTDLIVGIASDGRTIEDLDGVIGPLSKTLPVRCHVDDDWTFAQLLHRSRESRVEHVRWQALFAWQGGETSDTDAEPFCPLAFEPFDTTRLDASTNAPWTIERLEACADRVELKVTVSPTADAGTGTRAAGWDVRWTYDEQVHSTDHIACIADQYIHTLRSALSAAGDRKLAAIDIRGEWERLHAGAAPVVFGVRGVAAVEPIHHLFERVARTTPDREALVCGDERLTYRDLNVRADQLAWFLRAQGIGPETRVGLLLERSVDLLVAIFAVLKAGAAFVPLPPEQPIARLALLAERVAAPIMITHRHLATAWPQALQAQSPAQAQPQAESESQSTIEIVRLDEDADRIAAVAMVAPAPADAANLAYVMFTSGSTGEPKGVMVSHGALSHYVEWSRAAYLPSADVSVLLHSSIGFDATLTSLFVPLCTGARLIIAATDPIDAIADLTQSPGRRGFLKVTPAHLGLITERVAGDRLASLSATLVIGGDALNGEQLAAWRVHAPATRIVNEYGPTEAAVGCIVYDTPASQVERGPVPIGHPVDGTTRHVLDRDGRPTAVGVTGELYIGGAQLARGYIGRPDLTAERFLPDPFASMSTPGARCYRTGDLVRIAPDGALEYVGRRDHQVKLRGYRIELAEVETAIRQQPGVRETVVMLREDVPGERRLVAYVVGGDNVQADNAAIASDRLHQALRAVLPEFMVPALIVPLDQLPVTANGKVDRRRLPVPDGARSRVAQAYVAPRTEAEQVLAQVWADVLRLERVGIHDNFFALGGDSILSLQIVARAARAGYRLAPRLVFEHQTVEALAAVAQRSTGATVDQAPVTGVVPLTPVQHRFFGEPVEDRHHYNQALALDLLQPVPPAVLSDAWRRLQLHHDALRLRYRQRADGDGDRDRWEQINADVDQISPLTLIDASAIAPTDREIVWARIARAAQRSLHLERGPVARALLVDWDAPREAARAAVAAQPPDTAPARVFLVLHHVLIDGLSWRVLLEDLQELCRREPSQSGAMARSAAIDLPPKTLSLKAWSEKLTAFVRGGGFDDELPHWIAASEPGASIPRDSDLGPNTVASQRTEAITFSAEQTDALVHRLPVTLDTPVQDVLLTGLTIALACWTGERTWTIDLESHGREMLGTDDDVSRTVGWFTSVCPVRMMLPTGDDAVEPVRSLRAVRAAVRAVPRHGVGYGALRYLRDESVAAPLRAATTPEIIFNYWGQLDQVFASSQAIRPAAAPVGPSRSLRQQRPHIFEISASIVGGRLQVAWTYSVNLHEPQTIARLADELRAAVGRLAALPDEARARLKSPADFPLADLTDTELDRLIVGAGAVADVYPLSPLQEGMLFHRLYERDVAIYTQQFAARLSGPLDPTAFQHAWQAAVERHDVLRTGFMWERREQPLQVVREQATLPWTLEDWRGVDRAEQDARLAERLDADRRRGFDLDQPPLMRVGLIRLSADQWHILWTSHHIVLDGWSMPIVVRDVLIAYAAQRQNVPAWTEPPAARYRDYIAWLQRQDPNRAETFWRRMLDGIRTPTLVATAPRATTIATAATAATGGTDNTDNRAESARDVLRAELPAALVDALQRLGASHGVTMNTWFAGVWGLLLAHCTHQDDVLFGAVVSGRPPDLPGVEGIAGLFINTLPFRLRIAPREKAIAWFAECQYRLVDARDFEYTSLARIQSWSALPKGTPLFDTIFVFENYPVEQAWRQQTELRLDHASAVAPTSYPVEVEVAGMGSGMVVSVAVDRDRIGAALAQFLVDGFAFTLSRLVAKPDDTIGALLDSLDELTRGTDATHARQRNSLRLASLRNLKRDAATATAQVARPGLTS